MAQQQATSTEGTTRASFIFSEAEGYRARDTVTIVSGQNLKAGTVLGKITSGGKYQIHTSNDTPAGTGTAVAVLYDNVDASAADTLGVIINIDAEVNGNELTYFSGASGGQKTTANTQLAAVGIKVRP